MSQGVTCAACAQRAVRRWCGAYHFRCVVCCAALVISARPNRAAQQGMLACITRRPENPRQPEIVATIKQQDGARANANPSTSA